MRITIIKNQNCSQYRRCSYHCYYSRHHFFFFCCEEFGQLWLLSGVRFWQKLTFLLANLAPAAFHQIARGTRPMNHSRPFGPQVTASHGSRLLSFRCLTLWSFRKSIITWTFRVIFKVILNCKRLPRWLESGAACRWFVPGDPLCIIWRWSRPLRDRRWILNHLAQALIVAATFRVVAGGLCASDIDHF